MEQKFSSGISGSTQSPDHRSFFCNGIICCNCKHKSNDDDQNIQQHLHHSLITAHIFTGKSDGLIGIGRDKACHISIFDQNLQEILRHVFCFNIILWCSLILPGIAVLQMGCSKSIRTFLGHNTHTKFYSIKHHIAVIGK